jgi:hypothetical protein
MAALVASMALGRTQEAAQAAAASLQANAPKIANRAVNRAKNVIKKRINNSSGLLPTLNNKNRGPNNRKK